MTGFLPFPDDDRDRPEQAARLAPRLRALADQGIYFGTSSWKYEGWLGSIYRPERYATRGKFSQKKFEAECLSEYAETFPIVCGDFAFYQFPTPDSWKRLFASAPEPLLFAFKAPEDVTVARWPSHARYGTRAGKDNEHFLDAGLFRGLFARRLEPHIHRVATLIFEFGTFAKAVFPTPADFIERLNGFLAALPEGFRYAVEIRNPEYFDSEYLAMLSRHNVAHVLSAWSRMPELGEQLDRPGSFTADFTVVRALLSQGRTYEQAVAAFEPYRLVQAPNAPARRALAEVADRSLARKKPAFLFVNNRLEGHAPTTIEAAADLVDWP